MTDAGRYRLPRGYAEPAAVEAAGHLIGRTADAERGVDFWPRGRTAAEMAGYARTELAPPDVYVAALADWARNSQGTYGRASSWWPW